MHLGIVPMRDGKLSSKAMFDREELKKIQDELPQYLNEQGFELERGARNSEAKHLTVAEFKQEIAYKEIEQELVLDFGAPEYANNLGELVTKEEYQKEAYEVFQNELGNLFGGELFSWRETTFQEKIRLGQRTTKRRGGKTCRGKKASRRRNTSFKRVFEGKSMRK